MHTNSSIHVLPVKASSDAHNLRTGKPLDYVRQDRTHLNKSWSKETTHQARARIEETYKKNVGQKMQAKATPIREGVVNLGKTQDMETLKKLAETLEKRFNIKTIQIHIHEDEGYKKVKKGDWKQNRHAHMVFDWTDEKGKSLRLHKGDMADMQTIVAKELGMNRGESSDRKHLNSIAYKIQEMEKDAIELRKEINTPNYQELSKSYQEQEQLIQELKSKSVAVSQHDIAIMKARAEQEARELQKQNTELKNKLEQQSKNLKTAVSNSEVWKNNFKLVAMGKVSIEDARNAIKNDSGYKHKR